jgi:serine/threonine protein kinase
MEERLHPAVQAPINLNAFVPVRELPEGPSAKLWHMRTPEHDNWCVDCLFKSITLLMVHQSDLSQIMKEVGDWRTVSDHPNITRFYDSVWDPHHHRLVIVSEFMNCFSLKEVMAYQTSGIPEEVVGVIMQQTVAGLAHLHSSVHRMHRNIKPSNIVLNSKGEVKITDLGQSAKLQHTLDACNTMIASQVYMSPERIQGANYTSNCDVWSLGIVMVEMVNPEPQPMHALHTLHSTSYTLHPTPCNQHPAPRTLHPTQNHET